MSSVFTRFFINVRISSFPARHKFERFIAWIIIFLLEEKAALANLA